MFIFLIWDRKQQSYLPCVNQIVNINFSSGEFIFDLVRNIFNSLPFKKNIRIKTSLKFIFVFLYLEINEITFN